MSISCSDVCEWVIAELLHKGYVIDTTSESHDDIWAALQECELIRTVSRPDGEEIVRLARDAVDQICGYFYDYDDAREMTQCPHCESDIRSGDERCPNCDAVFDGGYSINERVYQEATESVQQAIELALGVPLPCEDPENAQVVLGCANCNHC